MSQHLQRHNAIQDMTHMLRQLLRRILCACRDVAARLWAGDSLARRPSRSATLRLETLEALEAPVDVLGMMAGGLGMPAAPDCPPLDPPPVVPAAADANALATRRRNRAERARPADACQRQHGCKSRNAACGS